MPLSLCRRAQRAGVSLQIEGCDLSPVAVEHAAAQAEKVSGQPWRLSFTSPSTGPLLDGYDVWMCSLFLHHLDKEPGQQLLERMGRQASRLVLVNDLIRGWPGYLLARIGSHVLSRSAVVHTDGPLSVQAAFTRSELLHLAEQAGLHDSTVSWRWPCGMLLTWRRP